MYILPAGLILISFHLGPAAYALYLSLLDWNMLRSGPRFVGLGNYLELLHDPYFWLSLKHTTLYVAGVVPTSMALSLLVAVLITRLRRGGAWYRALFFLPVVTAGSAAAVVWKWILYPDESGLLNAFLGWFGLSPQQWFLNPRIALPAIMLMSVWKNMGYDVLIFFAGLRNISAHYYEAAAIDGAGRWAQFRHITWPLLAPTTVFISIVSIISSFQVFAQVFVMTQGGPLNSTLVVVYYLYQVAFGLFRMGYAAAIAYVLLIIILILTIAQRAISDRRVFYA